MNKKLYKLMNWPEIEAVVYSEDDNPHAILGPHNVTGGTLVQFFYPGAVHATLMTETDAYRMEMADEEGFFAVLLPKTTKLSYTIEAEMEDGKVLQIVDPYRFAPVITKKDTERFNKGHHYEIYKLLGAHPMKVDGTEGVLFAVWAPNAVRVSVVGDFNDWNGRVHQMQRLWDSGIFEIFVPAAKASDNYKFEIRIKGGLTFLKADPYAFQSQLRPETASVVPDTSEFAWEDGTWLKERAKKDVQKEPVSIYELYLGSFQRKEAQQDAEGESPYLNYRELAQQVLGHVKKAGYTHVELMPVMEHTSDASLGYQVTGYYSPTSRYGTPADLKYFMNVMHKNGIGVILDWVPSAFPGESYGLSGFDGTCLYEHSDPRRSSASRWGTLNFNYARPEIANYLIANALYWLQEFHADGIRVNELSAMLYLDYGKQDGEWVPNMYGGRENLEAIEFIKQMNTVVHKLCAGIMTVAEDSSSWPDVTGAVKDGGLGFDLKWNTGWMNDFIEYMRQDPLFRSGRHGDLTLSMVYQYSERFAMGFPHDEVVQGKSSMIGKMPGENADKFKNLRAAYGYMMMHPGKKLLFMGQDIAEFDEWNENRGVQWELLEYPDHAGMLNYVGALNAFYRENPALYMFDSEPEGFEWINNISANENVVVFLRKTEKQKETLVIVCNFANEARESYTIGVPFAGKYKEIFNSDAKEFGGSGMLNKRQVSSTEKEWDDREDSITFKMPPLCVQVFSFSPFTKKEQDEIDRKKEAVRKRKIEVQKLNEAKEEAWRLNQAKEEAENQAVDAERRAADMERRAKEALEQAQKLRAHAKKMGALVKKSEKEIDDIEKRIKEHDEAENCTESHLKNEAKDTKA